MQVVLHSRHVEERQIGSIYRAASQLEAIAALTLNVIEERPGKAGYRVPHATFRAHNPEYAIVSSRVTNVASVGLHRVTYAALPLWQTVAVISRINVDQASYMRMIVEIGWTWLCIRAKVCTVTSRGEHNRRR